jgi:flagellar motor protein MotB
MDTGAPEFEVMPLRPAPPLAGPLLLGLFMLMLAIFIILVSFSNLAEQRAKAVLQAVSETFRPPATANIVPRFQEDEAPGTGNFPELRRLVQAGIPGTRVEGQPSASRLRLGVSTAALFGRGRGVTLGTEARALLSEVAQRLAAPPDNQRYDAEFLIGRGREGDWPLAAARAAVIAEALVAAGAPRNRIVAGTIPGAIEQSSIVFNARPAGDLGAGR